MRIRTIQKAYEEIKQADPETSITQFRIRELVINGDVPSVKSGNKYLVDLDKLLNHFSGGGGDK